MASKMYALAVFGMLVVIVVIAIPSLLSLVWAFGGLTVVFMLVDTLPARLKARRDHKRYLDDIETGRRPH